MLNLVIAVLCCSLLVSCEEGTSKRSRRKHNHDAQLEQIKMDPITQSHVYNWERLLASGDLLMGVTPIQFDEFRIAVYKGVFNPNTILSSAEINRIGRDLCTTSAKDETIGVRRLERTLTMAPELTTMRDPNGRQLKDWLKELKRNDLLSAVQSMKPE